MLVVDLGDDRRFALPYVAKPANVGSVAAGIQSVKDQLIPKIRALCPFSSPETMPKPLGARALPVRSAAAPRVRRCEVVMIGSSTGGPQALSAVLTKLPADFPVPIVVVQHMPPVFTAHLANRLNQSCRLEVAEA